MKKDSSNASCTFRTSIGGQALMEGILMRGPQRQAMVCRQRDGSLVTKVTPLKLVKDKYPILGWPLIRGVVGFLTSMIEGVKAIMWSAEQFPEDEQAEPDKIDQWINAHFSSETATKLIIGVGVTLGIVLAVGLFSLLPTLLAGLIHRIFPLGVFLGLVEGLFRIVIFLIYLKACSRMKEIERMWQYHGAEHKSIYCYESGLPLTVENARKMSRLHPRCGTSFLFIVILISILFFSLVRVEGILARMGLHLLMLPVLVAVSYEVIKWAGRHDNWLTRIVSAPGKALQRITTAEPDDSMLEVGLEALRLVLPDVAGSDEW